MEEVDKKVLCYYIISYIGACTDFDLSKMTDDEITQSIKRLEKYSYEVLLSTYDYLNTMFIEKFGFDEEF